MFVTLDGGIALPIPAKVGTDPFTRPADVSDYRWKADKLDRWLKAYTHCLYSLPQAFGDPLHSALNNIGRNMLGVHDANIIALRFVGEMQLAGYLTLNHRNQRSADKLERIIQPTRKFLGLDLDYKKAPDTAMSMPKIVGEDYMPKAIIIRRGISSQDNKKAMQVVNDIAAEQFTVNQFIFDLMKKFPPDYESAEFKGEYMLKRTMASAEKLLGKTFKFTQFLDSRSRMYDATTAGISPQGADWEKALCLPVYSERLTGKGVTALMEAAHGYAEKDFDLMTMIEHAKYPDRHWDVWGIVDKPYCYMACANLLRMWVDDPERPLPAFIPLDGRCSGLQHWSALTRSRAITAHLGMEANEDPQDIYEKCASDWEATLPEEEKQYATRKAAKIPVMTWGYNATRMTSMEHIDKLFGSRSKWCVDTKKFVEYKTGLERRKAGSLGCELYNQINETLRDLTNAVEWVSNAAVSIAEKGNADITWPTPDGFTCKQRKVKGEEVDLQIVLSNENVFTCGIMDFSKQRPAVAKHKSAIAPNVIHSLDATHLRMVARKLEAVGLPMIFVHDSFATHVNYRDTLYSIIVETFADLYGGDWLFYLRAYWQDKYKVELDMPPIQGDWDPESIKYLEKFFI